MVAETAHLWVIGESFRPTAEIRALRSCWWERNEYEERAGTCIQRMQKALTEMNIQLATVVKDLSGVTGIKILRAMVRGSGTWHDWPSSRPRIKPSQEDIAKT